MRKYHYKQKSVAIFLLVFFLFSIIIVVNPYYENNVSALGAQFSTVSSNSGHISKTHANWNTARDSATGGTTTSSTSSIGSYDAGIYYFYRTILRFNTSGLNDTITITNVSLDFTVLGKGTGNHNYYIINGENAGGEYLTEPNANEPDYNRNNWGYEHAYGQITATGSHTIYIDQNLTNCINLTGNTSLYLIYSYDYENTVTASGTKYFSISSDSPKLTIAYTGVSEEITSDDCFIGNLYGNIGENSQIKYKFFEFIYAVDQWDALITRIDIPISINQWNYHNTASDYYLFINGHVFSNPTVSDITLNWFGYTNNHKLFTFDNLNIENLVGRSKNGQWWHTNIAVGYKINGVWKNWQYFLFGANDLNGDGSQLLRVHNSETFFYYDSHDGTDYNNYEVPYRLWYDCYEVNPNDIIYEFDSDTVFISPAENGTLKFNVGDPVAYMVYSEDMTTQPYIKINKDESTIETITMLSNPQSRVFMPLENGEYNVSLVRGGIWRAGVNFTVYGQDAENYIYTIPPKSYPYQNVQTYYNFTQNDGYGGRLIISESNNFQDTTYYISSIDIPNNSSGSKAVGHLFTEEKNYYLFICAVYPNNRTFEIESTIHPCFFDQSPMLEGRYPEVFIDQDGFNFQVFDYAHNYVLWDVIIKISDTKNTLKTYHVGQQNHGSITHYEYFEGFRNSTLELLTNTGYIIIDYYSYWAKKYGQGVPDAQDDDVIQEALDEAFDEWQKFLIGVGIIMIFVFLPLWFAKQYNFPNIPNVLYLFSGLIGYAIALRYRMFDIYTVILFAIAFIGAIIWSILGQMGMLGGSTTRQTDQEKRTFFKRSDEKAKEK